MKNLVIGIGLIVAAGAAALVLVGNPFDADSGGPAVSHEGHADSDHWICVMDPEVLSDEPGDCPVCGMELVRKVAPAPPAATPDATPARPPARE